ncbi:hypothetical protein [Microvirga arsenatis]|uniref:Uncharacterized protein n=1 Tax=Microvirga arsenatis TaxID=2692265 RepID=A0ABW9Z1T1_9HYPH|nr:hypothetical protein [Microvirga arsenatis]NBJ11402.1 hypothetical protein [Microvirga arsenatis]NBJ25675.1 hypothetical protein [Microvirga arsenatis]
MNQHASDRDVRQRQQNAAPSIPVFKNVALPALAAAVRAAKMEQKRPKVSDLPAFLRKEGMLG